MHVALFTCDVLLLLWEHKLIPVSIKLMVEQSVEKSLNFCSLKPLCVPKTPRITDSWKAPMNTIIFWFQVAVTLRVPCLHEQTWRLNFEILMVGTKMVELLRGGRNNRLRYSFASCTLKHRSKEPPWGSQNYSLYTLVPLKCWDTAVSNSKYHKHWIFVQNLK